MKLYGSSGDGETRYSLADGQTEKGITGNIQRINGLTCCGAPVDLRADAHRLSQGTNRVFNRGLLPFKVIQNRLVIDGLFLRHGNLPSLVSACALITDVLPHDQGLFGTYGLVAATATGATGAANVK